MQERLFTPLGHEWWMVPDRSLRDVVLFCESMNYGDFACS
jgi:hypothetical protein